MEKNNGKIAIAIVAMFVVALSVVGFTYAYFTASVQGNTNPKSVEVTAGILQVEYLTGGKVINAQNVVPGWKSDGVHFYDPVASVYETEDTDEAGNKIKGIKAVTTTECNDGTLTNCTIETPDKTNGITEPATFTVENTGTDTAYYAIRLVKINNSLTTAEQENFKLTLTDTSNSGNTVVLNAPLAAGSGNGTQILSTEAIDLAKDGINSYEIMLEFANTESDQSEGNTGANISATIEIVGITQQLDDQGELTDVWVDADGNEVTFATAA